jgi:hypothetical protein
MLGPLAAKPTMHTLASAANAEGSRLADPAALVEQKRAEGLRLMSMSNATPFDPKKEKCEGNEIGYESKAANVHIFGCRGKVIPLPLPFNPINHLGVQPQNPGLNGPLFK